MGKGLVTLRVLDDLDVSGRTVEAGEYSGVEWIRSSVSHPSGQLTEYRLSLDEDPSDDVELLILGNTVIVTDHVEAGRIIVE